MCLDIRLFYVCGLTRLLLLRAAGPAAEHADVQVHRVLPRRGVDVAEAPVDRRHGHHHLDGGPAHLVAPREHLHRLRGHPETAARGLGPLRQDRRRLQGGFLGRIAVRTA